MFAYPKWQKRLVILRPLAIDKRRYLEGFLIHAFAGHGDFLVGCDKDRAAKFFGQVKGVNRQGKAIGHIYRGQHHNRQAAAVAPAQEINIAVSPAGR